jgi:signal transduction histidine kinase
MSRHRLVLLADVAVVLALAGTAWAQVAASEPGALDGGRNVHAMLVAAVALPLLLRRRHAVAVFATVVTAAWLQLELGGGLGQPFFAFVIALYAVGAHAPAPWTYVGPLVVGLQAVLVDVPRLRDGAPADEVLPAWFVLGGVWFFGRWMRHRAEDAAELVQRAESAEAGGREQAARAVADERARIARELHDLVAHSMGVIVIQAQGAQRALDTAPERARDALRSIETSGRTGLAEMRRLLGLLTDRDDGDTAPQPTLAELPGLLTRIREAGLPVDLDVDGDVRPLAPGLELAGYRIVQESLTNALKHADGGAVDLRLHYRRDALEIEVSDTGRAQAARGNGAGHGLVGMRERVALYGGTLVADVRPEGGFVVRARLPYDGSPA